MNELAGNESALVIDRMVLALIPDLDTSVADPDQQLPDAGYIVHTYDIPADYKGYVAPDQVVYSMILGTDVGDFSFNWIGMLEAVTDTVISVTVTPESSKWATDLATNTTGNNITRNVILSYQDAKNLTGITVAAETWQFDYQAELNNHITGIIDPTQEGVDPLHVTNSQAKVWQDHAADSVLHGRKNLLINGNFLLWQRGKSFTPTTRAYAADRWMNSVSTTMSRSTDIPDGCSGYSACLNSNGNDDVTLAQGIELPISGQGGIFSTAVKMSVQFWCKADTAGADIDFALSFKDLVGVEANAVALINDVIGTTPTEWTLISKTYTLPGLSPETSNLSMEARIVFNGPGTGDVYVAEVQLEVADFPTKFEYRHFQEELALCQRYFEKSYNIDVNPGEITISGEIHCHSASTTEVAFNFRFENRKRTVPTITVYSPNSGNPGFLYSEFNGDLACSLACIGESGAHTGAVTSAGGSLNNYIHFTAEAEL